MILKPRDETLSIPLMIDKLEGSSLFGFRKVQDNVCVGGPRRERTWKGKAGGIKSDEVYYDGEVYLATVFGIVSPGLRDHGVGRELSCLLGEPSYMIRNSPFSERQGSYSRFRYDFWSRAPGEVPEVVYLDVYRKAFFEAMDRMIGIRFEMGEVPGLRNTLAARRRAAVPS